MNLATEMFLTGIVFGVSVTLLTVWGVVYAWLRNRGSLVLSLSEKGE